MMSLIPLDGARCHPVVPSEVGRDPCRHRSRWPPEHRSRQSRPAQRRSETEPIMGQEMTCGRNRPFAVTDHENSPPHAGVVPAGVMQCSPERRVRGQSANEGTVGLALRRLSIVFGFLLVLPIWQSPRLVLPLSRLGELGRCDGGSEKYPRAEGAQGAGKGQHPRRITNTTSSRRVSPSNCWIGSTSPLDRGGGCRHSLRGRCEAGGCRRLGVSVAATSHRNAWTVILPWQTPRMSGSRPRAFHFIALTTLSGSE